MDKQTLNQTRILALHVRPQRFGFAVFKEPAQLLDWGGSTLTPRHGDPSAQIHKRITPLLAIYVPTVLIVRKVANAERERYKDLQPILRSIENQATEHSVEFVSVGREEVRRAFRQFGETTTKYHIAAQVAVLFPELLWKLPPARRPWQTEHHNMAIFDAVAIGVAYLSRFEKVERNL